MAGQVKTTSNCHVSIEFGRALLPAVSAAEGPVERIELLVPGSVVELSAYVDDYVDVLADGRLVARGLPVVIDGKVAVRVQESFAEEIALLRATQTDNE